MPSLLGMVRAPDGSSGQSVTNPRNCSASAKDEWLSADNDSQNSQYIVEEGARKKDEDWNPEENGGFAVHGESPPPDHTTPPARYAQSQWPILISLDTEAPSAAEPPADPFGHLEKTVDQQTWAKAKTSRLSELTDSSSRLSSDPYLVSSALRRRFREEKKVLLEKQGRDDGMRERYGLAEDVDLGDDEIEKGREMWEVGRERRGLPVAGVSGWEGSVVAVAGTPGIRRKGKSRAGDGSSPALAQALRKTTARKYDPFGTAVGALFPTGLGGEGGMKVKGKIKDSGVVAELAGGLRVAKGRETVMTTTPAVMEGGLLAGYGSD